MTHVTRDGGSVASRHGSRSRKVALIATFLLLTAGMVVSTPGLMSASATSGTSNGHSGDDGKGGGQDDGSGQFDCQSNDGHQGDDPGDDKSGDDSSSDNKSGDDSSSDNSNSAGITSSDGSDDGHDDCSDDGHDDGSDDGHDDGSDDGHGDCNANTSSESLGAGGDSNDDSSADGHDDCNDDGHGDCNANTSSESLSASRDGNDDSSDDGHDDCSDDGHDGGSDNSSPSIGAGDAGHHDGGDDGNDDAGHHDGNDDGGDCTPPPTTATLSLNKVVVNDNDGTATFADFILVATSSIGGVDVINGDDPDVDPTVGITADVPVSESYVLSESGPGGYDASGWSCSAGSLVGNTLALAAGDVANCTITNDDTPPSPHPPTITVDKELAVPVWGGTLVPTDFKLKIDGVEATQSVKHEVSPGPHTISELQRPGYALVGIVCTDLANDDVVGLDGSVTVEVGQDVECVVTNAEVPATLTLTKVVHNDDGGTANPSDFQLQIDSVDANQGQALPQVAGTHTITEQQLPGYQLVSIVCTDVDTDGAVVYDNGLDLMLGQHVSCVLTNDDDQIDLAITKSDDGLVKVAGGDSFDYTITVDNLGPRDAIVSEPVTVTDLLPAGFDFVSFPANCTAAGQTLTCDVDPADLQVTDPPVMITVTVTANPDAASGVYSNMAYVDTVDDPACLGEGCVPVCGAETNNIACETTEITREAGIDIVKVDDVDGAIAPDTPFHYFITVSNTGPSTFLANSSMTDDLPTGLVLLGVSAPSPWTCNNSDPIACTLGAALQPNTSAPMITVTVKIDPAFLGNSIVNEASSIAIVSPPGSGTQPDPGSVVTATDDETTLIARTANLSIDKSVSQATATAGDQFNWTLDVINHGPDVATNVVISDTIPAAFEVVGVVPSAGLSCTNTANSVQCTAATLANGATVSAVIQVRVLASAAAAGVTNTATVVTDSTDSNTADNTDSASITVTAAGSQAPVPAAPSPTPSPSPTLPRTGNGSLADPLMLAGLLFVGGLFSLVIARRRRTVTA